MHQRPLTRFGAEHPAALRLINIPNALDSYSFNYDFIFIMPTAKRCILQLFGACLFSLLGSFPNRIYSVGCKDSLGSFIYTYTYKVEVIMKFKKKKKKSDRGNKSPRAIV